MTLPALLQFGGDWDAYETELYRIFLDEIARAGLVFRSLPVSCRRMPESQGRWFAFWHLIQEGPIEDDRTPDLRRCERLRWIPYVILNAGTDACIRCWQNQRGSETNVLLWYGQDYLVVLASRNNYWLLKTAYCTTQSGRIRQLEKEFAASQA